MKHTPGPWKQNRVAGSVLIGTNGSMGFISIVSVELVGHEKPSLKQYTDESMANAQLIAAAPDLLDALEDIDILIGEPENTIEGQALIGRRILEMWPRIQTTQKSKRTMSNYPAGAANDSFAPYNQTEVKPTKVDVIVYEAATQFNGDVQNFVVHVVDAEPGTVNGCGATLVMALNDFEVSYMLRHNEPCEAVVTETKIEI